MMALLHCKIHRRFIGSGYDGYEGVSNPICRSMVMKGKIGLHRKESKEELHNTLMQLAGDVDHAESIGGWS
jgi:hypothetical protein